jgi:hypothetical protein
LSAVFVRRANNEHCSELGTKAYVLLSDFTVVSSLLRTVSTSKNEAVDVVVGFQETLSNTPLETRLLKISIRLATFSFI